MKKKTLSLLVITLLFVPILFTQASWDEINHINNNLNLPNNTPENIVIEFLKWLLFMFSSLAALAFVISGVMFLVSGGNSDLTGQAKEYIKYSIIGLIIGLSGYIIILFIDSILTGVYI